MQGAAAGYVSLPAWQNPPSTRKSEITINDVALPTVPALCCVLYIAGLPMWVAGMLTARTSVDVIFTDLGITADTLDRLKLSVLVSVIVLTLLTLALVAANAWLESSSWKPQQSTGLSLSSYTTQAYRINAANWLLLLALALALAGTITWLSNMSTALEATQGGGGGYGRHASSSSTAGGVPWEPAAAGAGAGADAGVDSSGAPPGAQPPPRLRQLLQGQQQPGPLAPAGVAPLLDASAAAALPEAEAGALVAARVEWGGLAFCPPGCIDLGVVAKLLGLPWPCFCSLGLLDDLVRQLQQVVKQLWVAVAGALLLFVATSWMFGYTAAQGAHAARDLEDILGGGRGGPGLVVGGVVQPAAAAPRASLQA